MGPCFRNMYVEASAVDSAAGAERPFPRSTTYRSDGLTIWSATRQNLRTSAFLLWCQIDDRAVLMEFNRENQDREYSGSANIALKVVIGVKAMAEIAHALGTDSDAAEYGVSAIAGRWLVFGAG